MSRVIHSPDNGSTASAIVSGPLGSLYIQALDAYGYQRELVLRQEGISFRLDCYQHPGRRAVLNLTRAQADRLVSRMEEICKLYPSLLFNLSGENRARCAGFVTLQEQIFRGESIADVLSDCL